jgi:hypothetical protein
MPVWIAGLIALGAITATYFSCVRPHLRNRGDCGMTGSPAQGDAELDRQVAELREELRVLRAQDALDSGRVPTSKPAPPTEV